MTAEVLRDELGEINEIIVIIFSHIASKLYRIEK